MEGVCTCRQVRYRLIGTPLIVHACHCHGVSASRYFGFTQLVSTHFLSPLIEFTRICSFEYPIDISRGLTPWIC